MFYSALLSMLIQLSNLTILFWTMNFVSWQLLLCVSFTSIRLNINHDFHGVLSECRLMSFFSSSSLSSHQVVLTSTEFDAIAVNQATSYPAISLPMGINSLPPEVGVVDAPSVKCRCCSDAQPFPHRMWPLTVLDAL